MEATEILQSDVLDIIFEHRNKVYGAYALRKNYPKQVALALGITFLIAAAFYIFTILQSKRHIANISVPATVITVHSLDNTKPLEKKKKIEIPKLKKAEKPLKVSMTKLTKPVVTPDKEVSEIPPKQIDNLTIGPVTQKGKELHGLLAAPPEVKGPGGKNLQLGSSNASPGGDGIFETVEVEARFPGGEEAWRKYLTVNLRQNIPLDNGAPQGKYMVIVSFLVSTDGSISDVKPVDAPNPDYGTAAEAIRVIQRGPKWMPAIQNGRPVPYRQKQRVIFDVQGD